jgi:hypothetical protein
MNIYMYNINDSHTRIYIHTCISLPHHMEPRTRTRGVMALGGTPEVKLLEAPGGRLAKQVRQPHRPLGPEAPLPAELQLARALGPNPARHRHTPVRFHLPSALGSSCPCAAATAGRRGWRACVCVGAGGADPELGSAWQKGRHHRPPPVPHVLSPAKPPRAPATLTPASAAAAAAAAAV